MGIALATFKTPPPTIPTTIDVVVDDDCIKDVARIPINNPTKGFEVVWISVVANPFPNIFREVPINSKLNMNMKRKIMIFIRPKMGGGCL